MTITNLINRACTLVRRTPTATTDDYGNELADEQLIQTVCELQQRSRTEHDDQGETSDSQWAIFLPAGTVANTGDQVIVDGETYELTGDPWAARNPRTSQASHIEATARRTAGTADEVGS